MWQNCLQHTRSHQSTVYIFVVLIKMCLVVCCLYRYTLSIFFSKEDGTRWRITKQRHMKWSRHLKARPPSALSILKLIPVFRFQMQGHHDQVFTDWTQASLNQSFLLGVCDEYTKTARSFLSTILLAVLFLRTSKCTAPCEQQRQQHIILTSKCVIMFMILLHFHRSLVMKGYKLLSFLTKNP